MSDANQRRAFYCQDALWQSFTNLAIQRATTVDALINEAMTLYLQGGFMPQQNAMNQAVSYPNGMNGMGTPMGQAQPMPAPPVQNYPPQAPPVQPVQPVQSMNYNQSIPAPPARQTYGNGIPPAPQQPLGARVPPPAPAYRRPPSLFEEAPADSANAHKPMVLASLQNQPPQYSQPAYAPQANAVNTPSAQPPLYIIFANQRYTVDKDKYIIGRSSQLADLVIRDANISRKHCAVIYKNGAYYIKDLDSTNGIEYKGNRIESKRIDEGDQFNICEFHFTFTYR